MGMEKYLAEHLTSEAAYQEIKIIRRSLRSDVKFPGVQSNSTPLTPDGLIETYWFAFKSKSNYQYFTSPETQGTDAFNMDWSQMRGFANPPWC